MPDAQAEPSLSFGSQAAAYERGRPSYPPEAIDWLLPPGAHDVLDLGAGTGKLTTRLVERGLNVVAVDPLAEMLGERVGAGNARTGQDNTGFVNTEPRGSANAGRTGLSGDRCGETAVHSPPSLEEGTTPCAGWASCCSAWGTLFINWFAAAVSEASSTATACSRSPPALVISGASSNGSNVAVAVAVAAA